MRRVAAVALAATLRLVAATLAATFALAATAAGLYAAGTVVGAIVLTGDDGEPRTRRIYVIATPIHTDIVVPIADDVADWRPLLASGAFPGDADDRALLQDLGTHVGFGWGASAFFLNVRLLSDIRPRFVLDALWDDAVMHVTVFRHPETSPAFLPVDLSDAGYRRLVAALGASFDAEAPIPGESYFDADGFFRAPDTYSLLVTCNVWAGQMLRTAGASVGIWTPFAGTLVGTLRRSGAVAVGAEAGATAGRS